MENPRPSEVKFVNWSENATEKDYDVKSVSEIVAKLRKTHLKGLDVGGGIGKFAEMICSSLPNCEILVIDNSELANERFVGGSKVNLHVGDFFQFYPGRVYDFLIFKTVLHHFIDASERTTFALQKSGLERAKMLLADDGVLVIEENFYEGVLGSDLTGKLIYFFTRLKRFETLFRALGANTAGEGVRFRSFEGWNKMLNEVGLKVVAVHRSPAWGKDMPLWQRLPLFCVTRYQAVLEVRKA